MLAYHSPLAVPLLESWVLPAAADAKLEGSGVGIMKAGLFWADGILHKETNSGNSSWQDLCGGFGKRVCDANGHKTRDGKEVGNGKEDQQ